MNMKTNNFANGINVNLSNSAVAKAVKEQCDQRAMKSVALQAAFPSLLKDLGNYPGYTAYRKNAVAAVMTATKCREGSASAAVTTAIRYLVRIGATQVLGRGGKSTPEDIDHYNVNNGEKSLAKGVNFTDAVAMQLANKGATFEIARDKEGKVSTQLAQVYAKIQAQAELESAEAEAKAKK